MADLVTMAILAEYLKRDIQNGNADDMLRVAVNSFVDSYCGRTIMGASYVEPHTVLEAWQTTLIVENPPIRALTSLTSGRTSPTLVDPDGYVVEAKKGIVRLTVSWLTVGVNQYTVSYDGGFAEPPRDLEMVALSIIAREAEKAAKGRHGMRSRSFAQGTWESFERDLEGFEKRLLDQYKLRDIG